MAASASDTNSDLILGWKVTKGLDPEYWLRPNPRPGAHHTDDLVAIPARSIAHHTVIVAQSGSGKSFFLGRLVEEILIRTKARVFIVDPNSDFRDISSVVDAKSWEQAGYDAVRRRGFLPDEESIAHFENSWAKIPTVVHSMGTSKKNTRRLQLDWLGISVEMLSEGLSPAAQNELRHCHEFVRIIGTLCLLTKTEQWVSENRPLDASKELFDRTKRKSHGAVVKEIRTFFPVTDQIIKRLDREKLAQIGVFFPLPMWFLQAAPHEYVKQRLVERIDALYNRAALDRNFVTTEMERIYYSNAHIVTSSGLLARGIGTSSTLTNERLQVVDLPSIADPRLRLLTVSVLLETEWARARREWQLALDSDSDKRVPTFIVLDEAHNLVPAETDNHTEKALREQFRRIAAEGRKFGLFLILVSQRPDKLDALVLSECENRAVMKLGSDAVLKITSTALGLGDVSARTLGRCLEFDVGRAMLAGPWVAGEEGPVFLYGAARRTREGGKNLDPDFWAHPISTEELKTEKRPRRAKGKRRTSVRHARRNSAAARRQRVA